MDEWDFMKICNAWHWQMSNHVQPYSLLRAWTKCWFFFYSWWVLPRTHSQFCNLPCTNNAHRHILPGLFDTEICDDTQFSVQITPTAFRVIHYRKWLLFPTRLPEELMAEKYLLMFRSFLPEGSIGLLAVNLRNTVLLTTYNVMKCSSSLRAL